MPSKRIEKDFIHYQSAHCESGSTSNLLLNYGLAVSEPLVFGIGSGIFFGYFPFVKVHGLPLITYRTVPGRILKNTAKRLGIGFESMKFRDSEKAMDTLDEMIDRGVPVGLRTGVYWLPYLPDAMRFHFNAHTVIAYGKKGDDYLISDPVLDGPVVCPRKDLMKARFAEGMLAPKGRMFYLTDVPEEVGLPGAILKGTREACRMMLKAPAPAGVRGIKTFARVLRQWPEKHGKRKALLYLGHTIRMQEEIGTGGGGFRLIYAAFLQEAAHILKEDRFLEISKRMTDIGDTWRNFALVGSRICKNRSSEGENYDRLSEILLDCAGKEYRLFKDLWDVVR